MMRILHVFSILDVGGMESYVMNMYRHIDRSQIQFDFLVHHGRRGAFEDEIEALGGRIFHMTVLDDFNLVKYRKQLDKLFRENRYQIVHGHLSSMALWYLGAAERAGVEWRILHSHCPNYTRTIKGYLRHFLFQFSPRHANVHFACSDEAGKYQFKDAPFEVLPNAIDVEKFRFGAEKRAQLRGQLNLGDTFVVGHVGRFFPEKNHMFMLKFFQGLVQKIPNAKLMLLGDGPLMEAVRQEVKGMGLEDSVLFMGLQKECAPYYSVMDCFVLPSVYEGLSLAGVEAQCAALPCLFTASASPKLKISENAAFLPVGDQDVEKWVDALVDIFTKKVDRYAVSAGVEQYDVCLGAKKMLDCYKLMGAKKV